MCLEYISWSVNIAVNKEGMKGGSKKETNGVFSVGHKGDLSQKHNPPTKNHHAPNPTISDLIFHIKHSKFPPNNLNAENIKH